MGLPPTTTTGPTCVAPRRSGSRWSRGDHPGPYLVQILGVGPAVVVEGTREQRIAQVAELQRARITRAQLRAIGVTDGATKHLISSGRLVREHRSVYRVRPAIEIPLGHETAALLACGRNALLGDGSAASLWKLCATIDSPVDVMVPRHRHPGPAGVRVHRAGRLLPRDVRVEQGLPVTSPARTLLDRAATLATRDFERELDEALVVLRIVDRLELEDVVARGRGHRGTATLRRLLARRVNNTITQSEAERLFLELVRQANLPEPEAQVRLAGFRVDFLWRRERVVFEIDGYRFHTSRSSFDRDRRKDLALKQAGYDPNRVSRDQVKYEPLLVLAHVAGALARAGRAAYEGLGMA